MAVRMDWFKTPHSIENDPRLFKLDDGQFRVWMCLRSMASQADERGVVPAYPRDGLAVRLRTTEENLSATLDLLARYGFIALQEDGSIRDLEHFRLLYENPSDHKDATRERKARSRAGGDAGYVTSGHDHVTTMSRDVTSRHDTERERDSDSDQDPESDREREAVPHPARGRASALALLANGDRDFDDDERALDDTTYLALWEAIEEEYPLRHGRRHNFERARKEFRSLTRREWRLRLIALGHYIQGDLARDQVTHYPQNFFRAEWRKWQLPHGAAPPAAHPISYAPPEREAQPAEPEVPPTEEETPAGVFSPYIAGVVDDYSRELDDGANSGANITRAMVIWQRSGLGEEPFVALLHQAKLEARKRQAARGAPRKIVLFFDALRSSAEPGRAPPV